MKMYPVQVDLHYLENLKDQNDFDLPCIHMHQVAIKWMAEN